MKGLAWGFSLAVVALRAWLVLRFMSAGWLAAVFAASEGWALVATVGAICRGDVDMAVSGWVVPVVYLFPLVLRPSVVVHPLAGLAFVVVVMLQFALRLSFGWRLTVGVPVFVRLAHRGAYSVVRHPMAAAECVMIALFVLAVPSLWNVAMLPLIWAGFVCGLLAEERFLRRLWCYEQYAGSVRYRLVPGVW
jgi:protein-S-isoprenylcysteine O-methyltransferase Ste14